MRVQWLLDRRGAGDDWSRRDAGTEYQDDQIRAATRNFVRAIEHRGLQPRFVSSEGVKQGQLRDGGLRLLMLPHTVAMAPKEAEEIRSFVERGGGVVADTEPGIYDEHGRRSAEPLLSEIFLGPATRSASSFSFGRGRAFYWAVPAGHHSESGPRIAEVLQAASVAPLLPLSRSDGSAAGDVETYIF